jgi:selenide,water dikinase
VLDTVLGQLAKQTDERVLVGFDKADDAGVYQLSPELALVQTVDFFTPIVDDPHTFGQIAAVNALSDVYAMGGAPLTALALVCFPDHADVSVLGQILNGGLSKMVEAGCTVVGGHSIRDDELKFGYAVTGTVHPRHIYANSHARVGDELILTKALGTGVISTAIKRAKAEAVWVEAAMASMTMLNKYALEAALASSGDLHAMTDVTGFGLIGHARELALGSNVSLRIESSRVPLLPGALECVRAGHVPGGLKANREFAECNVQYAEAVPEDVRTLLFDPQTAGGLLFTVDPDDLERVLGSFSERGVGMAHIGKVLASRKPLIEVV